MAGSEVPHINVPSVGNYVVLPSPKCVRQPGISYTLMEGSPKLTSRLEYQKFGISRKTEILERRRIHTTVFICGKGSSLTHSAELELSGSLKTEKLNILKEQIKSNQPITVLSEIMSEPDFLIGCWVKIRSNKGSTTPAFDGSIDGITMKWFLDSANGMRNGSYCFQPARRVHIPKPNGKKRPLTMPSPKDKIVQEGMRFLLNEIYDHTFKESSYGFRDKRGAHTALLDIRKKCQGVSWYIEGDIEQQFPSIDHNILVKILCRRIKDQPFIDLVYKYLRTGYGETLKSIIPMKVGIIQGGILSPILSNIYMHEFDVWMENRIATFNRGKRRKANPVYTRMIRSGSAYNKTIRSTLANDPNWKRCYYFRYADDFLIGVDGSRNDCISIRTDIQKFLLEELKMVLNVEKTKITHAETSSAKFLGYYIHKTKLRRMPIRYNSKGKLTRRVTRPIFDAPIKEQVHKLYLNKYAKKNGNPTRCGRLVNLPLNIILDIYKDVQMGILNYYALANNYGRLAARVHYILKYSCVLTIASKMKLNTMRRVYRKYGRDLSIEIEGKKYNYPTPSYRRPKLRDKIRFYNDDLIEQLSRRIPRGRKDLVGPCKLCGSSEMVQVHHVNALRKSGSLVRKDFIGKMMSQMNRKQIPVCSKCHAQIHNGLYDGPSFRKL